MDRNLVYPIGMVITILIGTYFYISCCSCCVTGDSIAETEPSTKESAPNDSKATSYGFSVGDGDFSHEISDNFNFKASSPSFLLPISESLKGAVAALADHLSQNTDRALDIVGFYKTDEENGTAYPNLGMARANSVKNHLVTQGISSAQINTSGQVVDEMVAKEDIFLGPVTFSIGAAASNADEELKALYDKIKTDPLVLYFDSGQAALSLTAEQRQKVADISRYLDKVEGAKCSVIGHTDNTGSRATNIALGQERAEFAKDFLIQNGILEPNIVVTSQGPDSPIASNGNEEGRAKNRRVVVTLN